jgi:hypothetical protein
MNIQATKTDIKEDAIFKTSTGRIGKAYAVSQRNIEEGTVNLFFEGSGDINNNLPTGIFKIESLTK